MPATRITFNDRTDAYTPAGVDSETSSTHINQLKEAINDHADLLEAENGAFLSGTVDGDALLADLEVGQAFHFQAVFGDLNLTSAQEIVQATDGLLSIQGVIEPLVIPNGTQGFITRNATGALTVFYVLSGAPVIDESGTVTTATTSFTSTNGACVSVGDTYQSNPDGTTYKIPSVAEYNEFINNYGPQYIALSYEAAGGANVRMNVNGVEATYTDLQNATDTGVNGQLNFSGGANGNFNRRARVDSEVLKNVGDYVEIIAPDVAPYSQMIISVVPNITDLADSTSGVYNLRVSAGANGNTEAYNFRDRDNNSLNSGSEANATYRWTRTLAGISYSVNGVEAYCTELTEFTDYGLVSPTVITNPLFGASGPIDINGTTNVPLEWTPSALGDYTVEATAIDPVGVNDTAHIRIGTTGVGSLDVLDGTAAANRLGDTNPLTRQYTFTVTSLALHTLTFGTGGGSAFGNVTAKLVSYPPGSVEMPGSVIDYLIDLSL